VVLVIVLLINEGVDARKKRSKPGKVKKPRCYPKVGKSVILRKLASLLFYESW
jgi:hypothetical protein